MKFGLYFSCSGFVLPGAHYAAMLFLLTLSVMSVLVSKYATSKMGVESKGTGWAGDGQGKGLSGILHL